MNHVAACLLLLILPALALGASLVSPWIRRAPGSARTPSAILNASTLVGALVGVGFARAGRVDALAALAGSPWGAALGGYAGFGLGHALLRLQAAFPPWIPSHAARRSIK